uniref:Putative FMRF-like protein n=1 Tax=Cupiennius salei TaxID=6928 RepID=A0A1U9W623_CUPSA|nr:putative FMRF-like protein [Cupiennius salei]
MALTKPILSIIFLFILFERHAESSESPSSSNSEDTSSIPMIASGKRQHNIMRFGKRPAGGHNLIHFGKRENLKSPQHSFLYFGKRINDEDSLPELIQYLQKNRDNSYKRGHTIMRFGKRGPGNHNFIRFGRGDGEEDYEDYYPDEASMDEAKRGGHSMLYFGKRGGHSMLYFGKRAGGHNILSFGKRDDDKRAHSMIHFGKREDEDDEDDMEEKRAHSMIHFGKREDDEDIYPDYLKRAPHSMIHFGKREFDEDPLNYIWSPDALEKKQHNLLRFGKKMDGMRKGSHAMIHFGKRDEDKRAHSMIHFGKRSVDQGIDTTSSNQSENTVQDTKTVPRMKREVEEPLENPEPLVALINYGNNDEEEPDEDLENAIKESQANMYRTGEMLNHYSYPEDEQALMPLYTDYRPLNKKEAAQSFTFRQENGRNAQRFTCYDSFWEKRRRQAGSFHDSLREKICRPRH